MFNTKRKTTRKSSKGFTKVFSRDVGVPPGGRISKSDHEKAGIGIPSSQRNRDVGIPIPTKESDGVGTPSSQISKKIFIFA